jgi:pimeloyl-ACP methyl ester carboxylesterase
MDRMRERLRAAGLAVVVLAFAATAAGAVEERFRILEGYEAPGTPAELNNVGVLEIGPQNAPNILVLNPGTSASAAYFAPLARTIVSKLRGWQVWAVERRENQLEDHTVLDLVKLGEASGEELFNYYLGWLADESITDHFELIPDEEVGFGREWGMQVTVEDLRRVVKEAKRRGQRVVLGGHSLGGSITTAYATWDFDGEIGARGLAGLVYIDGGSSPTPVTPEQAQDSLDALAEGSPWLTFGGITAPFAGLFNASGSLGALVDPDSPSRGQTFPLLPADLKPPVRVTNLGQYGYALDVETSPAGLRAAQAHLGRLADGPEPVGWDDNDELTPIDRYATMFSGYGWLGLDGTAWYHPQRLTLDSGAVAAGNENAAQEILDVRAIHGHELPKSLRIYAFGASLGGQRVLDAARILAEQSGISQRNLLLIDRAETYSHNDPNSAFPKNDFIDGLVQFLGRLGVSAHKGRLAQRPAHVGG